MPITVTAPRGTLTSAGEREILPRLTAAMLAVTGQEGNPFYTAMVGGTVHLLDPGDVYAGGVNRPVVMVELKLPDVGLADQSSREAFILAATDVVRDLAQAGHDDQDIWVNVLNARDGAWGIAGRALTNAELVAEITAAVA
jgi:phenylpyruvate tautomerase PptA (4-oxalocrotonate tautomerase family)